MPAPELLFFFFAIAAVYASAGFGGGSSYLAVLAVAGVAIAEMRPTALVCNLIVTAGGALIFWQKGLLERRIWPLFLSVPAAFLGARWPISDRFFMAALGGSLVVAGLLLLFQSTEKGPAAGHSLPLRQAGGRNPCPSGRRARSAFVLLAFLGAALGFLAGLTGIGGGIFLAPALYFLRFAEARKIAATASVFIFANSAAGLLGLFFSKKMGLELAFVGPLAIAVAVGGQVGSRLAAGFLRPEHVRWATAALVLYAGFNIVQKLF